MQQRLAPLRRNRFREEPLAERTKLFQPVLIFLLEVPLKPLANSLRERGAVATGRNGDLQRSAAHHRAVVKVAVLWIVDDVAENAEAARLLVDLAVKNGRVRGSNDEKSAAEIGAANETTPAAARSP